MLLVTGSNGMVGSYINEVFCDEEKVLTDLPGLDVTDKEKVFAVMSKHKPDFVLHLAAETDLGRCETDPDHAYSVNTMGTQNVALACMEYGATMIYLSTGQVFTGEARKVHTEFDVPSPLNIYGRSKYEGEKLVQQLLKKYYIFRAGWMFGGGPSKDKKFAGKILELCATKKELQVVDDKFGPPTFARDVLKGVKKLMRENNYGLYHLVNGGCATRYDFAKEIVKNLNKHIVVKPISSNQFPLLAPRPQSTAMKNYKLQLLGIDPMRNWQEALKEYINEWKDHAWSSSVGM